MNIVITFARIVDKFASHINEVMSAEDSGWALPPELDSRYEWMFTGSGYQKRIPLAALAKKIRGSKRQAAQKFQNQFLDLVCFLTRSRITRIGVVGLRVDGM